MPIVHAVDAGSPDAMSTRHARARAVPRGAPRRDHRRVLRARGQGARRSTITPGEGTVEITEHLISLDVREPLHPHRERFAKGLLAGKIIGQKSPVSGKVYVPAGLRPSRARADDRGRRRRSSPTAARSSRSPSSRRCSTTGRRRPSRTSGLDPARRHRPADHRQSTSATSRSPSSASACACAPSGSRRGSATSPSSTTAGAALGSVHRALGADRRARRRLREDSRSTRTDD